MGYLNGVERNRERHRKLEEQRKAKVAARIKKLTGHKPRKTYLETGRPDFGTAAVESAPSPKREEYRKRKLLLAYGSGYLEAMSQAMAAKRKKS